MISEVFSLLITGTAYLCQLRTLEPAVFAQERVGIIVCWPEAQGGSAPVLQFFGTLPLEVP